MSLTYHRQPTLQNARIRTVQDALQVFFAVARNALTMLTRRLDADERKAIRSGNVYIWEDRSSSTVDNGGLTMERWCVRLSPRPFALRAILLIRPPPLSPPSGPTECHGGHRAYARLVPSFPSFEPLRPLKSCRNAGVSVLLPERSGPRTSPYRWRVRSLYLRTSHCRTLADLHSVPGE